MSPSTIVASPEQVTKVLEVLRRSMPNGAMIERIKEQTEFSNEIIYAALHTLEREGTVVGRDLIGYGVDVNKPVAVDTDNDLDEPE